MTLAKSRKVPWSTTTWRQHPSQNTSCPARNAGAPALRVGNTPAQSDPVWRPAPSEEPRPQRDSDRKTRRRRRCSICQDWPRFACVNENTVCQRRCSPFQATPIMALILIGQGTLSLNAVRHGDSAVRNGAARRGEAGRRSLRYIRSGAGVRRVTWCGAVMLRCHLRNLRRSSNRQLPPAQSR